MHENSRMPNPSLPPIVPLLVEHRASLRAHNTFGLPAVAQTLIRVRSETELRRVVDHTEFGQAPKFVLGGGSNVVFTHDVDAVVLKIEIPGLRLLDASASGWLIEVGAGESWHRAVTWTQEQGWPGLENLALIPGSTGAAPVQNIGAYGVELKDRFHSLDAVDQIGRAHV